MVTDRVQLDWIDSFLAVVELGSFTAAAHRLHRAQSRISAHVAALESGLGAALFVRGRTGATPTPAGETFLIHAREIVRSVQRGRAAVAEQTGGVQGTLRLASYPGASAVLLAPIIRSFNEEHPDLEIELLDGLPDEVSAMVLHDQADIGLRQAEPEVSAASLERTPAFREAVVCLLLADHPLADRDSVDEHDLNDMPIVLTGNPGERAGHLSFQLRTAGIIPRKEILVGQPTTVAAFVNSGLGIGVMPAMAATTCLFGSLRALPIIGTEPWSREVIVLTSRTRPRTRAVDSFLHALRVTPNPPQATRMKSFERTR